MSGDPDPNRDPGSGSGAGGGEDPSAALSRTLVLNALLDVCGEGVVLADDDSRETVAAALDDALDAGARERLEAAVADLDASPGTDPDAETGSFLDRAAGAVLEELVARDVRATLVHDAPLSVATRDAALYSFLTTRDPDALADLDLPDPVRTEVAAGARAVADGAFEEARERFDTAVDAASPSADGAGDRDASDQAASDRGAVTSRVLAGFASHLAGADETAVDYVEETLHLETRAWPAKLVGYAADHRYPQKFRDGKLAARVFFRWSTDVPEEADITVSAGPAAADGVGGVAGDVEPLDGTWECRPLPRLWPETTVRVELSGMLPDLPTVQTYYVATGVVDLEVFEVRSVENLLLSGPATADAVETVRFE